eukprot:TRINITY_DN40954_c0_g1_i1.p1 TRINITY_DN40954_c0_g1~~TRINITY_DN40954_c0_g1_i1.p1  ORF type:complete len:1818 (+),score=330.36 TRINITY_DN40954_c0_g1_i1:54-5507(+)
MRLLEQTGVAIEDHGLQLSSTAKGMWKGTVAEGLEVRQGGEGAFTVRICSGLVRLGWLASGGCADGLGTDELGFGFGGTGKKSHAGCFADYGEAFGAGDVISCSLDWSGTRFRVAYAKNGRHLGVAFDMETTNLASSSFMPAICGKGFKAKLLVGPSAHPADPSELLGELALEVQYYTLRHKTQTALPKGKAASNSGSSALHPLATNASPASLCLEEGLQSFFKKQSEQLLTGSFSSNKEGAVDSWIRSALGPSSSQVETRADFRNSREVRRVVRTHTLPSGPTFTMIDSQPASRAGADRSYAQNLALWESLPRGHAEVRNGNPDGELLCEVAALRKFGNAEEKFGPLAREAGGARRAALALCAALKGKEEEIGRYEVSLVFLTKENGEMCKISFFRYHDVPYLVLGSKNVCLTLCASSAEAAQADLASYTEERFSFAKEMADVFLNRCFTVLSSNQRRNMVDFIVLNSVTLCGESISPQHQHIQSYRDGEGCIAPEIRFFAITAPKDYMTSGLTLLDPTSAIDLLRSFGLSTVEAIEEAAVDSTDSVEALEQRHLMLPNREGAVVYAVVRPHGDSACSRARTAIVYKWKNAWYVTVRALREKFCARTSEEQIRNRIRLLHIHHPDEARIVEEYLGFYRWALLLLPSKGFAENLAGSWVSLKASYDAFQAERKTWASLIPAALREGFSEKWLEAFPSLHVAVASHIPVGRWIAAVSQLRYIAEESDKDDTNWTEQAARAMAQAVGEGVLLKQAVVEGDEPTVLTVVLVRGLQGSGKSTLCRSLTSLLGGEWINQDEVAAAFGSKRRGPSPKELFLQSLEAAASREHVRYIFVDKIHTLKQHRDDVVLAVTRGFARRPVKCGRVALALLNLTHPEDEEGEHTHGMEVCAARIASRGLGHLSLVPQATDAAAVLTGTSQDAEVLSDEEKCSFDLFADIDLRQPPAALLKEAMARLLDGGLIMEQSGVDCSDQRVEAAVRASQGRELELRSRWKTLYWMVELDWQRILWGSQHHDALRAFVAEAIGAMASGDLKAVEDPHVTLLWLGDAELDELRSDLNTKLAAFEGLEVEIKVTAVCSDAARGLVALRVVLDGEHAPACQNAHPHITVAKFSGVAAKLSNDMLQRQADGDGSVVEKVLTQPVLVRGTVRRRLASESLAVAAKGTLPEGNPVCELGLASTTEATDIWVTFDASVRFKRVLQALKSLFCSVSEPLMQCRGWPPALRGKTWFTFHERPLSRQSISALEVLQTKGLFQSVNAAVVYFHAGDEIIEKPLDVMQAQLEERLSGKGAESLLNAFEALQAWQALDSQGPGLSQTPPSAPSFYVQCKAAGSQEQTVRFRQALAAVVSNLVGWEPHIKKADVTLTVQVKDDWVLLGLVIARQSCAPSIKSTPKHEKRASGHEATLVAASHNASLEYSSSRTAAPHETLLANCPDALQIDGAFLEGGGQILRSAFAYAAILGRAVHIHSIRGGRSKPGLRPSHLAAIEGVLRIAGGKLAGNRVNSCEATFVPVPLEPSVSGDETDPLVVDAGTGGSTMLMLQALLPVMLAKSARQGGAKVSVCFRGGTNVAVADSKGPFKLNAPQVDYAQLVLFPMLRHLFGVSLDLHLEQRGFLWGGGNVQVSVATPRWPLPACELVQPGEARKVLGVVFSSAGIPKHVLGRLLEGQTKRGPAGADVQLRQQLPEVPVQWDRQEPPTVNSSDACGLVLAIETSTGCRLGGDSMGRKGASAEAVGQEAANAALKALTGGGCADEHLEDQLVIFMALALGKSRLRLGKAGQTLHMKTALWLAEVFGAAVRIEQDADGAVLEIQGIGAALPA